MPVAAVAEMVTVSLIVVANSFVIVGLVSVLFVKVSDPARVAKVPVVGSVTLVAAVLVSVSEYAPEVTKLAPSAIVKVADVAGAVTVTLLIVELKVAAPAKLANVPTYRALAIPTPPAVIIEPVVVLEASVTRVELMPCAKGMRAVAVVCPSFVRAVLRPVPKSAVSALKAVLEMTVPETTGWPVELMTNVPEPL